MLPLKLTIEGVYSYQSKEVIDFENLTDAGLFGIFGAVGSGKSTILETIGFALYGNTERMNEKEKRLYNMLNLKSNKAYIEFDFLNFKNIKYRFTASWKRGRKFDEISPVDRKAYEWDGANWLPLSSNDGTTIVGLSYDNFKRTIIIPQGKFKEFLELKGKDRSEMMKEIFQLERFDLARNVGHLKKHTSLLQSEFKGRLEGFDAVTQEIIEEKKKSLVNEKEGLKIKSDTFDRLNIEYQQIDQLKRDFEQFEIKKTELFKLNNQKDEIIQTDKNLKEFEKIERLFKSKLSDVENKERELENANLLKSNTELEIQACENQLSSLTEKLIVYNDKKDELVYNKHKVSDLGTLILLRKSTDAINEMNNRIGQLDQSIELLKNDEAHQKLNLEQNKIELIELKSKRINPSLFVELGEWYSNFKSFSSKLNDQEISILQIEKEINVNEQIFSDLNISTASWRSDLDLEKINLEIEKEKIVQKKTKALLNKELANYSNQLHEGEDCPLCGSKEHPMIMQVEDVSELIISYENLLQKNDIQLRENLNVVSKLINAETKIAELRNKLNEETLKRESISDTIKVLKSNFKWDEFSMEDTSLFEIKKSEIAEIESKILEFETKLNQVQLSLENSKDKINHQSISKQQFVIEKVRIEGEKIGFDAKLEVLAPIDFETISVIELRDQKEFLHNENNIIEQEVESISTLKSVKENDLAGLRGKLIAFKENWISLSDSLVIVKEQVMLLLEENNFDNLNRVKEILDQSFNIEETRIRIQEFYIALQVSTQGITEIELKINGQLFSIDYYKELNQKVTDLKEDLEVTKTEIAKKDGEVLRLENEYIKKVDLLKDYAVINKRFENLSVLSTLFEGNGFVNYVSGIYLRNLADNANKRFHRITKNQLSLVINEKNVFEVVDYLNNGSKRSVKTLSGGQAFQASLCLALALAESIQTKNKNDKNFFFIDEGFGTQDTESVGLVYETLQSLMKENRIVGFISHLSELQERIPRSITVLKNDETGSYVQTN